MSTNNEEEILENIKKKGGVSNIALIISIVIYSVILIISYKEEYERISNILNNTNDLKEVLDLNHLYGVALDVIDPEPYPENSDLWNYDNVFITPHVSGGFVWKSVHEYFLNLVIRNIKHLDNNEPLENEVDFTTGYRKIVKYN